MRRRGERNRRDHLDPRRICSQGRHYRKSGASLGRTPRVPSTPRLPQSCELLWRNRAVSRRDRFREGIAPKSPQSASHAGLARLRACSYFSGKADWASTDQVAFEMLASQVYHWS